MENRGAGLERLCKIYLELTDEDKWKVIRLGEGLLSSQKTMSGGKALTAEKTEITESEISKGFEKV